MTTRTKKNKYIHELLKHESEAIRFIIRNAIDDYEFKADDKVYYTLDELFDNPIRQLEELMEAHDESTNNT